MTLSLVDVSGLTEVDPLFHSLKLVDKFLEEWPTWHDISLLCNQRFLLRSLFKIMGHPARGVVTFAQVQEFRDWLSSQGECVFASLVEFFMEKNSKFSDIRLTLMFIFCNLELLKERDVPKYRSIDSVWGVE